jgi:phosphatase NudJ
MNTADLLKAPLQSDMPSEILSDITPTSKVRWKPNVTVAALIERDGRFLLVEEETSDGLLLNNPAGHLDPGESASAAAWTPLSAPGCSSSRATRSSASS